MLNTLKRCVSGVREDILMTVEDLKDLRKFISAIHQPVLILLLGLVLNSSIIIWVLGFDFGNFVPWIGLILLLLMLLLLLSKDWRGKLAYPIFVHKINHQPSWVFYALMVTLFLPLTINFIHANSQLLFSGDFQRNLSANTAIASIWFSVIWMIVIYLGWHSLPKYTKAKNILRFAPDSAGVKDDQFGMVSSVERSAQYILSTENYISVVGILGHLGSGKSSYARMIVEHMNETKNILYTYVSLTETNKATDLGLLFQERWSETLGQSYPKNALVKQLPVMQSILRDAGYGLMASISELFAKIDFPLSRTTAKVFDNRLGQVPTKTSQLVGKLFGGIPSISEDVFVIIFDEIERAHFEEIYRLVEVIERFRHEGRTGLPVQIVFLLCFANDDFEKTLKMHPENLHTSLLEGFFFEDPKTFDSRLFVPPHDPEKKASYLLKKSGDVLKRWSLKNQVGENGTLQVNSPAKPEDFQEKESEALANVLDLLMSEPPRVTNRIFNSVNSTYASYFADQPKKSAVIPPRLSDLLAMELIKMKYPKVINFFDETVFVLRDSITGGGQSNAGWRTYFLHEKLKEDKEITNIFDWIKKVTSEEIPHKDRGKMLRLIALVYHFGLEWIDPNRSFDDLIIGDKVLKYESAKSLSSPFEMTNYLMLSDSQDQSEFRQIREVFEKHSKGTINLEGLRGSLLLQYARFLYDLSERRPIPVEQHKQVLEELVQRVVNNKYANMPYSFMDSHRTDAIYRVMFTSLRLVEVTQQKSKNREEIQSFVWDKLKQIFLSNAVGSDQKLQMFDSFVNTEKGSGSNIHRRLTRAFGDIRNSRSKEVNGVIQHVFDEVDKRYLMDQEDIYEKEENSVFVLFQNWSTLENEKEIDLIRAEVKKHLVNHPEALWRYHWQNFPDLDQGYSIDDAFTLSSLAFSTNLSGMGLYIPMKDLVEITNKAKIKDEKIKKDIKEKMEIWASEEALNNERLQEKINTFKFQDETLRSILTKSGYLSQDRPFSDK